MIIELLCKLCCSVVGGLLDFASLAQIPTDGIEVLSTVCAYGSYVVGADLLLTVAGCISAWALVKVQVGIGLFIWRLLPFT